MGQRDRRARRVLFDHCALELDVIDAERGKVLGRPRLVVDVDAHSRILGCTVDYGAGSP
jgi:hypothetical protein